MTNNNPIKKLIYITIICGLTGYIMLHIAYKIQGPTFLSSEWSAGSALSYFGTILGSTTAVYGLFCTFHDNRKGRIEQKHLETRPVLGINVLNQDYHIPAIMPESVVEIKTNISKDKSNQNYPEYYFYESKLETIFCIIEKGNINYTWKLTQKQLENVKHLGRKWETKNAISTVLVNTQLRFITLEICNYGNGPALNLQIGLNHASDDESKQRFAPSFHLSKNEKMYVSIYSENTDDSNCGEYLLSMHYDDVLEKGYYQTNAFSIKEDKSKRIIYELDCKTQQIEKN